MNNSSNIEAGNVLSPVNQNTMDSVVVEVNNENQLVVDAKNRLVDNKTQQLFKVQ